MHYSHPTVK